MALSDTIRQAFVAAQSAAGDTKVTFTLRQITPGTYNPATDDYGTTNPVDTVLTLFMYGLDEQEVDWFPADWEMRKVMVHLDDIPSAPDTTDYVLVDGVEWRINRVKPLPGEELFILYLVKS